MTSVLCLHYHPEIQYTAAQKMRTPVKKLSLHYNFGTAYLINVRRFWPNLACSSRALDPLACPYTVKPLITNTSEEFIKCRLGNFSMSFILYYVNFSICENKYIDMNMREQF